MALDENLIRQRACQLYEMRQIQLEMLRLRMVLLSIISSGDVWRQVIASVETLLTSIGRSSGELSAPHQWRCCQFETLDTQYQQLLLVTAENDWHRASTPAEDEYVLRRLQHLANYRAELTGLQQTIALAPHNNTGDCLRCLSERAIGNVIALSTPYLGEPLGSCAQYRRTTCAQRESERTVVGESPDGEVLLLEKGGGVRLQRSLTFVLRTEPLGSPNRRFTRRSGGRRDGVPRERV